MRGILSERNLVIVLFVMVLITFSFAQKDTRKMEELYLGTNSSASAAFIKMSAAKVKSAPTVFISFHNPFRFN